MKRILMLAVLLGGFGMAQADEVSTSIENQPQAKESLAETCWNLKTGDLDSGKIFVLALIATENATTANQIDAVFKAKKLSHQDRDQICNSIPEPKI